MKTKLFMLCTIVCAISLTCCEEEKPIEPITLRKVETGEVSEVTLTSATFHGVVNVDISQYHAVTFGIMLSQSKAELNEREGEMFKAKPLIGTDFKIEIGDLKPETKYYYCSWLLLNNTQYEFGDIKEFETLVPTPSTVITNPITKITTNSALAGGYVKDDGGASVTERGIVFGTSKEPTTSNYKVKNGSDIGEFTCNLTNLKDGTTYYVRAYAISDNINEGGTAYGDEVSFTTKAKKYENGHEYIDLGLSVKWATCNVGAYAPEDRGNYYAWGETEIQSAPSSYWESSEYTWDWYSWCFEGKYDDLTKYCTDSSYGRPDNKTTLELSDDVAHVEWGGVGVCLPISN